MSLSFEPRGASPDGVVYDLSACLGSFKSGVPTLTITVQPLKPAVYHSFLGTTLDMQQLSLCPNHPLFSQVQGLYHVTS